MPKTLREDATFYLKQLHRARFRHHKLENYDYSHFNVEAFVYLAKERFTEKQLYAVTRLFGLDGNPSETPTQLAARLKTSVSAVYALKDGGYRKLRNVWDYIFAPTPWDFKYKDSDYFGVLPLSTATWYFLARHGFETVKDFKEIDEQFMKEYFSTRKLGAAEIYALLEKLRYE